MISKGNHVEFARFVLLAVSYSEKAKIMTFIIFFRSMYKRSIRVSFSDIQNNQSLGKGCQPPFSDSANNNCLDIHYCGYHKNLIQYLFIAQQP